jgi:predicted DCC family thiol-disulfide oxidoreductase YuxK
MATGRSLTHPVILFDGVCGLCNAWVDFLLARDRKAVFRFAALQSDPGKQLLAQAGLPEAYRESVVLIDEQGLHTQSTAALRIFRRLGLPYSLMYAFVAVPRFLRNWVYDFIGRNRYRWFGKTETCRLPTAQERERFLV